MGIGNAGTGQQLYSRSFITNVLFNKTKKSQKYSTNYIWLCKPGYESHIENELADLKLFVRILHSLPSLHI